MICTTRHISDFFERWAPNATKLEYDNTGLLSGNSDKIIHTILTCLDVTPAVINEAITVQADLIVAHHPLIFPKITSITEDSPTGSMLRSLIKNDIDLIAAHTNLDAASQGVSFELAQTLGLQNIRFLDYSYKSLKLVVLRFPGRIRGSIQNLLDSANLEVGWSSEENNIQVARFSYDEHRLSSLKKKIDVAVDGAPFSLDVLASDMPSHEYGFGAIGSFKEPLDGNIFLDLVSSKLDCSGLRFSGDSSISVKKVAVCGGSGSSLIRKAFSSGADAYITADIKYHDFFKASNTLLVDAGHYETEAPIIHKMTLELLKSFPSISVLSTKINTNPMKGWNQHQFSDNKPQKT